MFKKATKTTARLRILISGIPGSGKTFSSLSLATELIKLNPELGRIAVLDTERSASIYADRFDFDVDNAWPNYHPHQYVQKIAAAQKAGYKIIIIDSFTHAWQSVLDIVEESPKKWLAGTPVWKGLIQAIINADAHVICTSRQNTAWEYQQNERGKMVLTRIGTKPELKPNADYEFNLAGVMELQHLTFYKSVIPTLFQKTFKEPGAELAQLIYNWLNDNQVKATWDQDRVIQYCKEIIDTDDPILINQAIDAIHTGGTAEADFQLDYEHRSKILTKLDARKTQAEAQLVRGGS